MRILVILLSISGLTGCLSLVNAPRETKPPATSGHKVLDVSLIGSIHADSVQFDLPDEAGGGSVLSPWFEENAMSGIRFSYGITDNIDIVGGGMKNHIPVFYTNLGVKYQWLGKSVFEGQAKAWSSTAQLKFLYARGAVEKMKEGYWEDKASEQKDRYISGEGSLYGFSLSNSFGYMFWDWLSIYGGGEVTYLAADYAIEIFTNQTTKKTTKDHLWFYGPFAGFQLHTTGPHWRIIFALEAYYGNKPNETAWYKGKRGRAWEGALSSSLGVLLPF